MAAAIVQAAVVQAAVVQAAVARAAVVPRNPVISRVARELDPMDVSSLSRSFAFSGR